MAEKLIKRANFRFLFGSTLSLDLVENVLTSPELIELIHEVVKSNLAKKLDLTGLNLYCYKDFDTDFDFALASVEPRPSKIQLWTFSKTIGGGGNSLFRCGLQFILKGAPTAKGHYCVYRHTWKTPIKGFTSPTQSDFRSKKEVKAWISLRSDENFRSVPGMTYVGISGRGWTNRYMEHIRVSAQGSSTMFHKAYRESEGKMGIWCHDVVAIGLSKDNAYELEENLVAKSSLYPMGLNMIPGGYAGIRYLHKLGALSKSDTKPAQRDEALATAIRSGRISAPNPKIALLWLDSEYAEKVITGAPGRLTAAQVRQIRALHQVGKSTSEICQITGARNDAQVDRVIRGKTYSRIR